MDVRTLERPNSGMFPNNSSLLQSSIQLALSVQIPRVLSGNQGETMYFLFSYYDH